MSRGLAAIVHRLLQKDPQARYARARELAAALAALSEPAQPPRVEQPRPAPPPQPPPPVRVRVRRRPWIGGTRWIAAALLLAILGGAWLLRWRTVTLADVRHAPLASAQATLSRLGVTPAVTSRSDMRIPAGTVISESPVPGTHVQRGSVVRLLVSSGPPLVHVPDVDTMDVATAEQTLLRAKLHTSIASRPNDAPPNTVIGQNPPPGATVRAGTTAVILVSTGPTPPPQSHDESPPPGWLRRTWWHLFHRRHGNHDGG
jgi:hypothetical protein